MESKAVKALTSDVDNEYNPAFSPQGEQVIYVSEKENAPGIYSLTLDGGHETQLYGSEQNLNAPSLSPDGKQLIFNSFDGKQTRLIKIDGTTQQEQILSEGEDLFPFRVSWTNTSDIIYTADGKIKKRNLQDNKDALDIPFRANLELDRPDYQRKTYDFDQNTPRAVQGISNPAVAPDGQTIVFTALGNLWLHHIESGVTVALTEDAFVDMDPNWSPDGSKIAFCSDRRGQMELYTIAIADKKVERLTDLEAPVAYPVWSPDGTQVAFYQRDPRHTWGKGELKILDLATGEISALQGSYFAPSKATWSPDGKYLAMMVIKPYSTRYREGLNHILLLSTEGETPRYVLPKEHHSPGMRNANGPSWSPDGQYIAYIQEGLLWRLPVDKDGTPKGAPEALNKEMSYAPSWAADSKRLVYLATDQLKVLDVASKTSQPVSLNLNWRQEQPKTAFVIHAGRLFTGKEQAYQEDVDVVIEGNRIKEIVPHRDDHAIPIIDASDKTVLPGLFESHTHMHMAAGEKLGRIWLANGVTSVREPGADPYDALERRESWNSGQRPGPRLFFTGGLTDGSRIYYDIANSVTSSANVELELERAKRLGYDLIKTYVRMPDSLQQLIIEKAHAMGIPVSSHEIYPSTSYNVDAIEHIRGTSRRGYSMKQTAMRKTYQDVVELLAKSQITITPTIGLQGGFYVQVAKDPSILENQQFISLYPESFRSSIQVAAQRLPKINPSYINNFESIQESILAISEAGGRICPGTDSPFIPYGTSFQVELQLLVASGLSPYEVLQGATVRAAELVGVEKDLGSLEAGKLADLIIVEGDPLSNIKDTWNVVSTFKNGIRYDLEELLGKSY